MANSTQTRPANALSSRDYPLYWAKNDWVLIGISVLTGILLLLVIVLGAAVRLTEAEQACGNAFPLCNNQWIPSLGDGLAWLDWGHRLSTLLAGGAILASFTLKRRIFGTTRPDITRPIDLCLVLLVVQSVLGAGTMLGNPPTTLPLLHMALAVIMLSCITASLTAFLYRPPPFNATKQLKHPESDTYPHAVYGATVIIFLVLMSGAMISGAEVAKACDHWLVCQASLDVNEAVLLQLIHRLCVVMLGVVLVTLLWRTRAERPAEGVSNGMILTLIGLYAVQVAVGGLYIAYGHALLFSVMHVLLAGLAWATGVAFSTIMIKQDNQEL